MPSFGADADALHPVHQRVELLAPFCRVALRAVAMARKHPLVADAIEPLQRSRLLLPGVPGRIAKGDEALLAPAEGKRVAREQEALLEKVDRAALGVTR